MSPKLVKATIEDMPEVARLFRISRESELPYLPKLHTPEEDLEYFKEVFFNQCVDLLRDKDKIFCLFAHGLQILLGRIRDKRQARDLKVPSYC